MGSKYEAKDGCYFGYLYGYKCRCKHPCKSDKHCEEHPSHPSSRGLFDRYSIGTLLIIGTEAGEWRGAFAGLEDDVALLFNAHRDNNPEIHSPVRIPLREIVYVTV